MLAAGVEMATMLTTEMEVDAMPTAEEGQSMLAAGKRECSFRYCLCPWQHFSLTPRVVPGSDYVNIPADADRRPGGWSLLVGVADGVTDSASSLRVSRLRVARSGRILGRSDDALDVFHNIVLDKPPKYFEAAASPLAPDRPSLCVVRCYDLEQPQALQLTLHPHTEELPLPEIGGPLPEIDGTCGCIPIYADGHMWALSATLLDDDIDSFRVVARRLVSEPGGVMRWEHVGAPFTGSVIHYNPPPWSGFFLQGYAVLPDHLILVSFQNYGLFLTFNTMSGHWAPVLTDTDEPRLRHYLPIHGRGIYVQEDEAIYMLRDNTIYTYKLTYHERTRLLKLDPPVMIDYICPFIPKKGYGILTCLTDRLMCSVWISLGSREPPCTCHYLHAIVTTFHLPDEFQGRIKVLHSTFRRLDMVPNPEAHQQLCFLQEYADQGSLLLQQHEEVQEDLISSQHVDEPSERLMCCRRMLRICKVKPGSIRVSHGRINLDWSRQPKKPSSTIPPLGPSCSVPVDPSSRQHEVHSSSPAVPMKPAIATIKKDLFIICEAGSRSLIFQTGAKDDDGKPLQRHYFADEGDHYWHFFQSGSKIHAVSSIGDGMLELSLNKDLAIVKRPICRPAVDPFVMVIRVGGETIALTRTLQVFHQTRFSYDGSTTWSHYMADESSVVSRRVTLSGYAAVNDNAFIVYDAVTCSCLLFDLGAKEWSVVMPWALKEDWPTAIRTNGVLNGRCVFVDGFIYTCRNGGLAAYELLGDHKSVYLSRPIFLPFSWDKHCLGKDMCLDYAGKDVESGANLFYVLQQDGYSPPKHGVRITTVKVKTKGTASDKMKPAGIDHVGSVMRFIHHTRAIETRCCFAVSCL